MEEDLASQRNIKTIDSVQVVLGTEEIKAIICDSDMQHFSFKMIPESSIQHTFVLKC